MSNNTGSGRLAGKWPAVVKSYDGPSRTCEVDIPGITDGAETPLVAEIEYPIGDKSRHATMTEIEILPGDKVWVEFIQGDPRYPLISGWRNPKSGNDTAFRRWHHANIELLGDALVVLSAGDQLRFKAGGDVQAEGGGEVRIKGGGALLLEGGGDGQVTAGGAILIQAGGGSITLQSATGTLVI
ncbi:MAG: hypothetical protein K9L88_11340 [Chromatiaceae bacterium]|nr:hypothetical protein [Chromatiaceae bacterium]